MNSFESGPMFFDKPTFRASGDTEILRGSARRIWSGFDQGHRFSCSFSPQAGPKLKPLNEPRLHTVDPLDRMIYGQAVPVTVQLDQVLERRRTLALEGESPRPPTRFGLGREARELAVLLLIVAVILANLLVW